MSKKTGLLTGGVVCLSLVFQSVLGQAWQKQVLAPSAIQEEKGHEVNPQLFRVLSFGHLPVAVDWNWLQILIHAPQVQKRATDQSQLFFDLHLIADLDPAFREVYTYGAHLLSLMYFDAKGAVHLLKRGLDQQQKMSQESGSSSVIAAQWQNRWEIPLLLGYFYFFELDSMEESAQYFKLAAQFQDAPTFVQNLGQKLSQPLGQYQLGLSVLSFMLNSAQSEQLIEKLTRKKENFEKIFFIAKLNLEFAEIQRKERLTALQAWSRFYVGKRDLWGGELSLDSLGHIQTTTPYEPVFGLH